MPRSPALVLVDEHAPRRAVQRSGLPSAVVGVVVGLASLVPFLLPLLR